jgi:uncharacterized protein (TIGR02246 family)
MPAFECVIGLQADRYQPNWRGCSMRILSGSLLLLLTSQVLAGPVDEVRCREIGFSLAAEARDAERFASFIDADARFVGSSVLQGTEAIVEAWLVFFSVDGPSIKWRPQFVEVLDDGTLALTRGPYRVIAIDEFGNRSESWGTFNSVWRKQDDGSWKVVFDAGSQSSEPPAADIQALLDQQSGCAE